VAHIELYMGLVEVSVGLVPAGGGCKEMLRRVMNPAMTVPNADPFPVIQKIFETIDMAKVSVGAVEAREMGYLQPADRIVMDRERLLGEAKREVLHLALSGYVPPRREKIYAGGRDMLASLRLALFQMGEGEHISDHDRLIGEKLGWILAGGDISAPAWVDEQYILDLEREAFVELIQTRKTMERVLHTLKTGKPLRN
jgi:3-hydroxyacyl-CoA dehydrogenase